MYKNILINWHSQIITTGFMEGESIEEKMRRTTETNEPIEDTAPMIYTERKDGVLPEYDIRTDRFDVAVEGMDVVSKSYLASRAERAQAAEKIEQKGE